MAFSNFLRFRSPGIQWVTAFECGAALAGCRDRAPSTARAEARDALGSDDAAYVGAPLMAASEPADERWDARLSALHRDKW